MNQKQHIDDDLKAAMIAGDKRKVDALRLLKSAILNEEISSGEREVGLSDDKVINVLLKEAKKRRETIKMYEQSAESIDDVIAQEKYELSVIETYLPEAMSDDKLAELVQTSIQATSATSMKDMGRVVQYAKQHAGPTIDTARLAEMAKKELI